MPGRNGPEYAIWAGMAINNISKMPFGKIFKNITGEREHAKICQNFE
jgi:hypothetical protein